MPEKKTQDMLGREANMAILKKRERPIMLGIN